MLQAARWLLLGLFFGLATAKFHNAGTPADIPAIDRITERVAADGHRLQTVLHEVVQSQPFMNRPTASPKRDEK